MPPSTLAAPMSAKAYSRFFTNFRSCCCGTSYATSMPFWTATMPAEALQSARPRPTTALTTDAPPEGARSTAPLKTSAASPGRAVRMALVRDPVASGPAFTRPKMPTAATSAGKMARNQ